MKNRVLTFMTLTTLSLVLLLGFGRRVVYATFIGDTILIEHHCCTIPFGEIWDSHTVLVEAGNTDCTLVTAHTDHNPTYSVDVEASSFLVEFIRYTNFTAGNPFHGLVVSDLDWLGTPNCVITGANVVTDFSEWSDSRLDFGEDWVSLDWQGLNVPNGSYFNVTLQIAVSVIDVIIDIKPGSDPNSINLSSAGVIPIAILSSHTFDATTVNPDTVSLAGASVKLVGKSGKYLCHEEEVNGDSLLDLVCQVYTVEFMIEEGESVAVLEAETYDGSRIRGEDSIHIVPD